MDYEQHDGRRAARDEVADERRASQPSAGSFHRQNQRKRAHAARGHQTNDNRRGAHLASATHNERRSTLDQIGAAAERKNRLVATIERRIARGGELKRDRVRRQ